MPDNTQPENLVLQLLREMRTDMATKTDVARIDSSIADVRSEVQSLRADVASDLVTIEKRLGEQIVGLRRAVMEYHSSAIGHGMLISEFEERLRRVEQQLGIDGAH
jgi:hypothetical protein